MASEASVQRDTWKALGGKFERFRCVLFRTNAGKAVLSNGGKTVWHADGSATVPNARSIGLGMCLVSGDSVEGLADLNGYTSVEITPDMVGRRVAVYTALEMKRTAGGKLKKDQITYQQNVANAGGIAGFVRSVEEGKELVLAWLENRAPRIM